MRYTIPRMEVVECDVCGREILRRVGRWFHKPKIKWTHFTERTEVILHDEDTSEKLELCLICRQNIFDLVRKEREKRDEQNSN